MTNPPFYMVFDVESVGLHGEGYAVGWVVVDLDGVEHQGCCFSASIDHADGARDDREWVTHNANPYHWGGPNCDRWLLQVRDAFWSAWRHWKNQGAVLVADVPWPVESRFLIACIADDPVSRTASGPYPMIDVASVRLAAGLDPLGTVDRLPAELPVHNPLADARQSARLLIEALNACRRKPVK